MSTRDMTVYADSVELIEKRSSNYGGSDLQIDVINVDVDSMLSDIGVAEAVGYFDVDDVLEEIKVDEIVEFLSKKGYQIAEEQ